MGGGKSRGRRCPLLRMDVRLWTAAARSSASGALNLLRIEYGIDVCELVARGQSGSVCNSFSTLLVVSVSPSFGKVISTL